MTKYLSSLLCIFLMLLLTNPAFSQSAVDRYNIAKTQYENGNYTASIQTLKSLEQSIGANPKIQSLLVYAYVANNDFVNAKIELNKYKRMVPHSSSQAHKDLLTSESNINKQIQLLEKNHTANIEATRMKKADEAINRVYSTPERRQVVAMQQENKKIVDDLEKKQKKHNEEQIILNEKLGKIKVELDEFNIMASQAVQIGQQTWMTHNLNVSYFRNGDPIPEAKTAEEWKKAADNRQPAWCYINNDSRLGVSLGKLYNWYAVNDSRGLAPEGWHIASKEEWNTLVSYYGNSKKASPYLKSTKGWGVYNKKAIGNNKSGFSARYGEFRLPSGQFEKYNASFWWTSSATIDGAWCRAMNAMHRIVFEENWNRGAGMYVRLVKD